MKRLFIIAQILLLAFLFSTSKLNTKPNEQWGKVVWKGKTCDYYIIETYKWFVLLELYNGTLKKGDEVTGDLHTYGLKKLYNKSRASRKLNGWIENHWQSKDKCIEWLKTNKKCDIVEDNN